MITPSIVKTDSCYRVDGAGGFDHLLNFAILNFGGVVLDRRLASDLERCE
jgi:hypothetical protein